MMFCPACGSIAPSTFWHVSFACKQGLHCRQCCLLLAVPIYIPRQPPRLPSSIPIIITEHLA